MANQALEQTRDSALPNGEPVGRELLNLVVRRRDFFMLTGELRPWAAGEQLALAVLALLFASPLLLMGSGMTLVGVLALGPREDIRELWICLPAGVTLLGAIAAALYYALIRVPGLTVTRFCLDGCDLVLETPQFGCLTFPSCHVRSVCEVRRRRARAGRKPKGWWLRIEPVGWVYLDSHTPNAGLLISQLSMTEREPKAAPITGSDG